MKRNTTKVHTILDEDVRVDNCMRHAIDFLNKEKVITAACCCGHGKYPLSIVVLTNTETDANVFVELFSGKVIPRKRRYYVRDNKGFYFIPEAIA